MSITLSTRPMTSEEVRSLRPSAVAVTVVRAVLGVLFGGVVFSTGCITIPALACVIVGLIWGWAVAGDVLSRAAAVIYGAGMAVVALFVLILFRGIIKSARDDHRKRVAEITAGQVEVIEAEFDAAGRMPVRAGFGGEVFLLRVSPTTLLALQPSHVVREMRRAERLPNRVVIARLPGSKHIVGVALSGEPIHVRVLEDEKPLDRSDCPHTGARVRFAALEPGVSAGIDYETRRANVRNELWLDDYREPVRALRAAMLDAPIPQSDADTPHSIPS